MTSQAMLENPTSWNQKTRAKLELSKFLSDLLRQVRGGMWTWEVDSSYHVQTNMNLERGFIWGTNVHNIHKGEVLSFCSMYT